jgi:hypothetical protein
MPGDSLPAWAGVLSAAARFRSVPPDAVFVGGTAAAVEAVTSDLAAAILDQILDAG